MAAACAGIRGPARHGHYDTGEQAQEDNSHLVPPDDLNRRLPTLHPGLGQLPVSGGDDVVVHWFRDWLYNCRPAPEYRRGTLLVGRDGRFRCLRRPLLSAVQSTRSRRLFHNQAHAALTSFPALRRPARWRRMMRA